MFHIYNRLNFYNQLRIRDSAFIYGCSKINKTKMNTLVSKNLDRTNCVIAGNPARIIKSEINWNRERL